jgi:hypothetical protein
MADTKISALTVATSVAGTDIFPLVQSVETRQATFAVLTTYLQTSLASTFAADSNAVHKTGAESVGGVKAFSATPTVPDSVFGAGWNGSFDVPTKNAVYDQIVLMPLDTAVVHNTGAESVGGVKTFTSTPVVPDQVYGVAWLANLETPTKNAVYNKIETISAGGGATFATVLTVQSFRGI